jgi:hypothetical protein
MVTQTSGRAPVLGDQSGSSLVELIIAAGITLAMVGAAITIATQVQRAHSTQLEDVMVEEEARYTLDWIARLLESAGSNPYAVAVSPCPAAGTAFIPLRLDPDGDGVHDDLRIQADVHPPNGLLAGPASGACTEADEDVTVSHDPVNLVVTRRDNAIDAAPIPMTEPVFTDLRFAYLDAARNVTANAAAVAFVRTTVTGRSRVVNPYTGQNTTITLQREVRLRRR